MNAAIRLVASYVVMCLVCPSQAVLVSCPMPVVIPAQLLRTPLLVILLQDNSSSFVASRVLGMETNVDAPWFVIIKTNETTGEGGWEATPARIGLGMDGIFCDVILCCQNLLLQ